MHRRDLNFDEYLSCKCAQILGELLQVFRSFKITQDYKMKQFIYFIDFDH